MLGTNLPHIVLWERLLNPVVIVGTLLAITLLSGTLFDGYYLVLAIIVVFLCAPIFEHINLLRTLRKVHLIAQAQSILMAWVIVAGIVVFLGYATQLSPQYSRQIIMLWFVITPIALFIAHVLVRALLPRFNKLADKQRSVVIAGANELALQLIDKIKEEPYLGMEVEGLFDDRSLERLNDGGNKIKLKGRMEDLPDYVRKNRVSTIFIALPMSSRPQIMKLIDDLYDTTASIYFVLDIFGFNLIQPRVDAIRGIPVVAICESPFCGINGATKRASDIVLATAILTLLSPLMILIALGVKLSSPGPALFKQRRYGLNGEEIKVYKFRSMTVCEDGDCITQATKDDQRITKLGAFLRKTSLDELPQFVNVLLGDMSIVGPRPHAVAHNEMYRKYIKGYMLRHKVRPGITGWAQVHGLRGETETIDKMKARIDYDLDYLRNWSLSLDLWVILKTAFVIFNHKSAY